MELNINDFLDKYIEEKHSELLSEIKNLRKLNNKIESENILLRQQLETTNSNVNFTKTLELLQQKINIDSIKNMCKFLLPLDNNIESQFKEDAPLWFELIVKHWNNKDIVISLLKGLKVKLPSWMKNIKMPYEYDEKELDLFFDTLRNHYVCNSCIYQDNLGFWYREFSKNEFNIDKCLKNNYSQIPWQLLLRNPLLLEDKYILKITDALNKEKSHSPYFLRIFNYQTFTDEKMRLFINNLKYGVNKDLNKLIEQNIKFIDDQKLLDMLFNKVLNNELYIEISKFNQEMQKIYYFQCKDINKILNAACLTKEEKLSLISNLTQ